MNDHSEIMEELWRIKQELSAGFKSFHDYFEDLLRRQSERYPELANKTSPSPAVSRGGLQPPAARKTSGA